ncbi:MAG: ATP-binding cassette domain-containing protein [Planctomycetes bacterium]|nr:ATP-binding cassette domain-containing protein [Planctomycetota bacterium]
MIRAVDGVDLQIPRGTTLGLVGESGCGKTTLGRAILRLIEPTDGQIIFDGVDVLSAKPGQLRNLRRRMQIVFQDSLGTLNPRMRVGWSIAEPLAVHAAADRRRRSVIAGELLERVGLHSSDADRYPHELSGGQRQRIGIARALALQPELLICDEPVSALDVSIQAQILNLLSDLQEDLGLTYLFIAHDLAVVRHVSDRVAVMYLGKIVETAGTADLYDHPQHPYTIALLDAVPTPDPTRRTADTMITGDPQGPLDAPSGCAFHPRCPHTTQKCRSLAPSLTTHPSTGSDHRVACHHVEANEGQSTVSAAGNGVTVHLATEDNAG